jgi:hypothetical protein
MSFASHPESSTSKTMTWQNLSLKLMKSPPENPQALSHNTKNGAQFLFKT